MARLQRAPVAFKDSLLRGSAQHPATWSVSFVAVLAYIYSAVTYGLPLVTPAMALATLGLFLEGRPPRVPLFIGIFALWLGWAAVGYTSSVDGSATYAQAIVLAKIMLICFVIANVVRDGWRMRIFLIFFLACFAAYPARGTLVNFFIVRYTIFGRALWNYIYSNSNDLAALTFLPLSMAAAVAMTEKNIWMKRAAIVGLVVLPLMMLLTQSRGALIALVVTGLVFFVLHTKGRRTRSLLTAVAASVFILPFVPQSAWERFSLMKNLSTGDLIEADPEGSAEARYNIWRVARVIIKENPITGIGLGVYPRAHAMYAPRVGVPVSAIGFRDTHSTYLNVAAETGIPGVVLFLGMIGVVVASCERARWRSKGSPRAKQLLAFELGLLGFLLAGVFGSFAKLSFLYVQLAIMWALADITNREIAESTQRVVRGAPNPLHRSQARRAV